jgi:hypothetical protein
MGGATGSGLGSLSSASVDISSSSSVSFFCILMLLSAEKFSLPSPSFLWMMDVHLPTYLDPHGGGRVMALRFEEHTWMCVCMYHCGQRMG